MAMPPPFRSTSTPSSQRLFAPVSPMIRARPASELADAALADVARQRLGLSFFTRRGHGSFAPRFQSSALVNHVRRARRQRHKGSVRALPR